MSDRGRLPGGACLLALLAACADEPAGAMPPEPPPGARPPVVLIVLDTLRADRLSLHGYGAALTPELEELATRATVHHAARSTAPWTLPAHASLFTGLWPFEHGAHTRETVDVENRRGNAAPLAEELLTLAELLGANGYRTAAFFANVGYLRPKFQLGQGFGVWERCNPTAAAVNAEALGWLREHVRAGADAPPFVFLNYMDVHRPYRCPDPAPFPGAVTPEESAAALDALLEAMQAGEPFAPELVRQVTATYDCALAELDRRLGELFDELRALGLFDEALIVVTSDHGEYFGEHGLVEHSKDVYREALHVPLIVKAPGQAARADDHEPISLVHVPGIALSCVDASVRPPGWEALVAHWPRDEVLAENYYSRLSDLHAPGGERFDRVRRAVFDGRWNLIDTDNGDRELYDHQLDPGEEQSVLREQPARASSLVRRLALWLSAGSRVPDLGAVELSEEDRRDLEALGY